MKSKKGFTIVELVIVIAVIAILAAVLIPTFSNIIKKANTSTDTQLVKNLNDAVAMGLAEEGKNEKASTAYEAMQYAKNSGYDVAKIVAKSDYNIAWSVDTGDFVLIDTGANKAVYPTTAETKNIEIEEADRINYFVIVSKFEDAPALYSIYAGEDWDTPAVTVDARGFDAGEETVTTVTYKNTSGSAKNVILRSNGGTLSIDDTNASSHQYHYGFASVTNVKTGSSCYEGHAIVDEMNITEGKAVAKDGAYVGITNASEGVTLKEDGGVFFIPEGTTTADVPETVATQIGYTVSGTTITATTEKTEEVTKAAEEAEETLIRLFEETDSYVVRIGATGYATFEEAVIAAQGKAITITLLADVDLTKYTANGNDAEYTVDLTGDKLNLNGHKITSKNHAIDFAGDNVVIENGTFEVAESGSYALCFSHATATLKNISTIGGINVHTSTVEIYNGSCNETKGTNYYALWADVYGTIIVYSGKYSSPSTSGGCVVNAKANDSDSTVTIKGGDFEALGTANMFSSSANIVVEGGTFNKEITSNYYTSPYAVKNNNDGTWTVYNSASYKVSWSAAAYTSIANKTNLDAAIAADPENVYCDPNGLNSSLESKKIKYTSDEIVGWGATPADVYEAYGMMWTAAACPKMWFTYSSESYVEYFDTLADAQACADAHSGSTLESLK